jgi:ribonuclease P protein component
MRTITAPADIERLFTEGKRGASPLVLVLTRSTPTPRGPSGRVVFVAGKKLGGAVQRNRAKRVLRAACARAGGPWDGSDTALIARRGTGAASPAALDSDLRAALGRAGVIR